MQLFRADGKRFSCIERRFGWRIGEEVHQQQARINAVALSERVARTVLLSSAAVRKTTPGRKPKAFSIASSRTFAFRPSFAPNTTFPLCT